MIESNPDVLLPAFRTVCRLLGVGMFGSGVISALNPIDYADNFGHPIRDFSLYRKALSEMESRLTRSGSGWVAIFAGRELTLGSSILILNYLGEFKALSVLVSALYWTALGDALGNIKSLERSGPTNLTSI
ncbi:hypothetical protein F1880_009809 [Penicillium rolfsii]|nr:hypothetical protein F1880_009809 [Penicillium rolfsii]